MATTLSVNLNAIAMLRNRRDLPWPNILHLAGIALNAGAGGITVHPRPDERHIRFQDVEDIACFLRKNYPQAEFNIEGFPSDHFLRLVSNKAQQITLVPDKPEQKTSDHGWDFSRQADYLLPIISRLKKQHIRVSLFANPDAENIEVAKQIGADRVEFYTGLYASAWEDPVRQLEELEKLRESCLKAYQCGLGINAGHDLTLQNLPALLEAVPYLCEVSIGHSLTASALEFGMEKTVRLFKNILNRA